MLGLIFTYQNTPSLSKLYFQLEKEKEVSKGQFVSIEHNEGKVIGLVVDIFRFNPYFEQTSSGLEINNLLPIDEWNNSVVEVKPLGIIRNKRFGRLNNPPYPGSKVDLPTDEELKLFLGFKEKGLNLGKIPKSNTFVNVDMSKLLQKHLAILAMSGAGKSYTVSVLLEELLSQEEENSIGIVLFDVHGEYKNFAEPVSDEKYKDYSKYVRHYDASKLKFGLHSLDEGMFAKIVGVSAAQYREISRIFKELREGLKNSELFDFKKLKESIENSNEIKGNAKSALLSKLAQVENLNLFGNTSNFNIKDIVKPKQLTIIDMSDVLDMTHKQVILAYFANYLFRLRRKGNIAPFLLVLEEAHQFVPEGKSEEYMKARSIIETIAREGRKFGATLCLISQRPIKLSTTVLSQCNTHIILRITNPYDLKHISESSEGLDSKSTEIITGLEVGEALMVGSAVNYPLFFKVRERTSQPNKYELSLQDMVKEYLKKQKQVDEEIDAYL